MKVELDRGEIEGILNLIARADIKGNEAQAVVIIQAKLGGALGRVVSDESPKPAPPKAAKKTGKK